MSSCSLKLEFDKSRLRSQSLSLIRMFTTFSAHVACMWYFKILFSTFFLPHSDLVFPDCSHPCVNVYLCVHMSVWIVVKGAHSSLCMHMEGKSQQQISLVAIILSLFFPTDLGAHLFGQAGWLNLPSPL